MKLRELKPKDAPLMLEWMHDSSVTKDLFANFEDKTEEDCLSFIDAANKDKSNIHLAIVTDDDEYIGTVSLKHIDKIHKRAEFAIVIRAKAMGLGYSWYGMNEIIKLGFNKEKLKFIYWCVSKNNIRACKFYNKHNFSEFINDDERILGFYKGVKDLKWFFVKKDREIKKYKLFKKINNRTFVDKSSGQLSFVEGNKDIPFEIKRIYYITNVKEGMKRGYHAHKNLKQYIFCPFGKVCLLFDDGRIKEEILLDSPSEGVLIEKPLWREMIWIEKNSVLFVLASDYYDENDYIRNYTDFLLYINDKGGE